MKHQRHYFQERQFNSRKATLVTKTEGTKYAHITPRDTLSGKENGKPYDVKITRLRSRAPLPPGVGVTVI